MATFTVLQRGGRYFLCLLFFGFFSLCCLSAMSMSSSPSSSLSPSNGTHTHTQTDTHTHKQITVTSLLRPRSEVNYSMILKMCRQKDKIVLTHTYLVIK